MMIKIVTIMITVITIIFHNEEWLSSDDGYRDDDSWRGKYRDNDHYCDDDDEVN